MFCFVLFTLCSASALKFVFSNSSYGRKYCKTGDFSDFQRGQIVGASLTGASVTKTAPLLGVSRAALPKVMATYTIDGKTSSAEGHSGRKPKLCERDSVR